MLSDEINSLSGQGGDAEDAAHATEREANLRSLFLDLERVALDAIRSTKAAVERDALSQASQAIACNTDSLIGTLCAAESDLGSRGDILGLVADLFEATFEIGRFGAVSSGSLNLRSHQSLAARKRAGQRIEAAKVWQNFCERRAIECRKATPSMTTDDLAEIVRDGLPVNKHRPGLPAIAKHIRALVRAGVVPAKRRM